MQLRDLERPTQVAPLFFYGCLLLSRWLGFLLKQRRFARQAPAVAAEAAVAGDHPVAGYQQAQWVAGTGASHGAWTAAKLRSQFGVVTRLPQRNLLQGAPHLLLKCRAANIQRQLGGALRFADLRQYLAQAISQAGVIHMQFGGGKALLQFTLQRSRVVTKQQRADAFGAAGQQQVAERAGCDAVAQPFASGLFTSLCRAQGCGLLIQRAGAGVAGV